MKTLRGRLIAMVAALVAVTIGGAAIVSTRMAHYELRKFEVDVRSGDARTADAIEAAYRAQRSWAAVQAAAERIARTSGEDVLVFDAQRQLVATSNAAYRSATIELDARGVLTIEHRSPGGRMRELLRAPRAVIHDPDGSVAGFVFTLPAHKNAPLAATRSLDQRLLATFAAALLFGVAMAVAIARRVTEPLERLTLAARRMEAGDLTVRVEPSGGAELESLAGAFNAMAAAVDRNEELRRRMVSDVAHELRAPLTNIRCELESMQDGLTAPTPDRIASLHEETMQLAHLIDDLQDLALADAGRLELDPGDVPLAPLARRAAAGIEPRARERGVALVCEGEEEITVRADARRTVQILTNLLANAITHVDAPGTVTVRWQRSGREAIVQVADSGSGIAPEELPRIFERFYRVDTSRSRMTGGAGLGLPIVRQLVAAHGGRVWAESEPGRGSTFSFTLPLASS